MESTSADPSGFSTLYQQLTRHRLWPSGSHQGSHPGQFQESTLAQKAAHGSQPYHRRSPAKPEPTESIDSTHKNALTFLTPLTYPLIIEELRPEDTPRGRFCFPDIAEPVQLPAILAACWLMMENSFQMQFDAVEGPRENMFFLLNAGAPRRVERQGSMLDVYPTLLEALGYDLVGGRAGLGRSFLSDGLTLVEQHSEEGASRAIQRNYALAEWLWRAPGE